MSGKNRILASHEFNIEDYSEGEEINMEDFVVYTRGDNSYWAAHKHGAVYIACEFRKSPKLFCFRCYKEAPPSVRALVWMLGQWRHPLR